MSSYTTNLTKSVTSASIHKALGITLISQTSSPQPTALLDFTTSSLHLTPNNTVHGGISSLAIDGACFLALIPTLEDGEGAATIASSFQILGAVVGEGKKYEVEGRVIRRGKRIAFCEGDVRCEGKIIAKGSLTKVVTSPKGGNGVKSIL